jgi:hypothetical protein
MQVFIQMLRGEAEEGRWWALGGRCSREREREKEGGGRGTGERQKSARAERAARPA